MAQLFLIFPPSLLLQPFCSIQGESIESTARNEVIQLKFRTYLATKSRHDRHFESAIARNSGLPISVETMVVLHFMIVIKERVLFITLPRALVEKNWRCSEQVGIQIILHRTEKFFRQ